MNRKERTSRPALTRREADTLRYIVSFRRRHNVIPTRIEIAKGIGIRAKQAVDQYVSRLEEKGYVETEHRGHRHIRVLMEPDIPIVDGQELTNDEPLLHENRILGQLGGTLVEGFKPRPDVLVVDDRGDKGCLLAVCTDKEIRKGQTVVARNKGELISGTCVQVRNEAAQLSVVKRDGTQQDIWVDHGEDSSQIEGVVIGKVIAMHEESI